MASLAAPGTLVNIPEPMNRANAEFSDKSLLFPKNGALFPFQPSIAHASIRQDSAGWGRSFSSGRHVKTPGGAMSLRVAGGKYKGRRIRSAGSADLRPTTERVRGAIFSILGPDAVDGARVLDLYAGTGVLAIEAISRGAAWADLVELDFRRAGEIRENLRSLSVAGQARVYRGRTLKTLQSLPGDYDLVFADPPYDLEEWDALMTGLNVPGLVKDAGVVVAEHRHGTPMGDHYGILERVTTRRYGDTAISIYRAAASG